MMSKTKWNHVPVSFTVELGRSEDSSRLGSWEDLTYGKFIPDSVLEEVEKLVPADCDGLELDFDIVSSGYSDPGRTYGDPYYCYPPEQEDERVCKGVYLLGVKQEPGGKRPKLSKASASLLEGLYQEAIDNADLPEQDYDGPDEVDY